MGIRAVAKAAGVSPSTAALALKGGPGVALDTVERVQRAARESGYRPGQAGRPRRRPGEPKAARRTHRLALVSWQMPESWLNSPVFMAVIRGVEEGIRQRDKAMVLRRVPPGPGGRTGPVNCSVDGVVLFGQPSAAERSLFTGFPCVRVMGAILDRDTPWDHITYDDRQVGVLAADYLLSRGHRQVAFIGNPPAVSSRGVSFLEWSRGQGAQATAVLAETQLLVDNGRVQAADGAAIARMVERFAALAPRPTGIFVHADAIAQALQPALTARGIRAGHEVEIVSCNNEQILLNGLTPRPATVDIHAEAIGRRAVEQLLARLENPNLPRLALALAPELMPGSEPQTPNPEPGNLDT